MSRESITDRVARVVETLRPEGIVSVYLFGSHAAFAAHTESDVDLGVLYRRDLLRDRRTRFEAGVRLAGALMAALETSVDVVVLDDAPPHFARKIVLDGRCLVCTDPEADHAFVRDVQLRAADLEPFLRRARAVKLEALRTR